MQKGLQRFNYFLDKLEELFLKAGQQKNPALFLYQNNARTTLFMLEGLAKMYSSLHNKKRFSKLKEHFKLLEDAIGAIDYYDAIAKKLSSNKKIPPVIIQYLQAQTREKIQRLNELLTEKKWLGSNNDRILKIRKKLASADWQKDEKETTSFVEFYNQAIRDIIDFTHSTAYHFDNMEEDVHELRRKLRWLSIYPQALQGCIQLASNKNIPKHLSKYLTKEIVNSPYNKMPDAGNSFTFLLLNKNYFLSLSWLIDKLGKLKDEGLTIIAIKEAFQQTKNTTSDTALKKAYKLLGNKQILLEILLKEAESVCKIYFKEQNLMQLVLGIGRKYA